MTTTGVNLYLISHLKIDSKPKLDKTVSRIICSSQFLGWIPGGTSKRMDTNRLVYIAHNLCQGLFLRRPRPSICVEPEGSRFAYWSQDHMCLIISALNTLWRTRMCTHGTWVVLTVYPASAWCLVVDPQAHFLSGQTRQWFPHESLD